MLRIPITYTYDVSICTHKHTHTPLNTYTTMCCLCWWHRASVLTIGVTNERLLWTHHFGNSARSFHDQLSLYYVNSRQLLLSMNIVSHLRTRTRGASKGFPSKGSILQKMSLHNFNKVSLNAMKKCNETYVLHCTDAKPGPSQLERKEDCTPLISDDTPKIITGWERIEWGSLKYIYVLRSNLERNGYSSLEIEPI